MLGAVPFNDGVNFAVYSKNATKVVLDLFEAADSKQPYTSIEFDPIKNKTGDVWHIYVKGLKKGTITIRTE